MSEPGLGDSTTARLATGPWDLSTDMLAVASLDGYLTAVNASWERVLGYSPAELTSRPYLDLVHPDDVAATAAEAQALFLPGHVTVSFENRYRGKDGDYRWLSWSTRTSEDGQEVYCIVRDVTEHRVREAARTAELERLRRRDLMLTGVLENDVTLMYVKDLQGRYLLYNRSFAEATHLDQRGALEGKSGSEVLIGRDDTWLDPIHASKFRENDRRAERGPYRIEEVFGAPDLGARTYESIKFPLSDTSGTVYATCGISLDTTDRTQPLEALTAAAEALRDSENHYPSAGGERNRCRWELDADTVVRWVSPSSNRSWDGGPSSYSERWRSSWSTTPTAMPWPLGGPNCSQAGQCRRSSYAYGPRTAVTGGCRFRHDQPCTRRRFHRGGGRRGARR